MSGLTYHTCAKPKHYVEDGVPTAVYVRPGPVNVCEYLLRGRSYRRLTNPKRPSHETWMVLRKA